MRYMIIFIILLTCCSCGSDFQDKPKQLTTPEEKMTPMMEDNDFNNCGSDHPLVGEERLFSTLAHGVSGKATILSNCEIRIENFNFDGGGAGNVAIWGAKDSNFLLGYTVSDNLFGQDFVNEDFNVFLPENMSFDDINSLSVWCIPFNANFGSVQF